ncbi:aspartyl protease family protein [Sphingobium sp. AN558]|uniref:aspartyl protease family protein n=1 Tax=Sphingobium sp. AN558 TaxID=3133442 RepID=UPI0030C042DA
MKSQLILASSHMLQIKWRHDGKRIVLPVKIFGADNLTDMTSIDAIALLDTGATVSGINADVAARLGLRPIGKRPILTAHGLAHIDHFLFRLGAFPDDWASPYPFIFPEIIGLSLSSSEHFSALLGMDVLRHCDFAMDRSVTCRLILG